MPERQNHRLVLSYDGRGFFGFARQPELRTVEGTILDALRPILPDLKGLAVGGRTDRGVSAKGQVISFWTRAPLELDDARARIDAAAPGELRVKHIERVPRSFHARFSARARRYVYWLSESSNADVERLNGLLASLVGERCFRAFSRDLEAGASTVRVLTEARVRRFEGSALAFRFTANGFLRKQIRVLVATALRAAEEQAPPDRLVEIANSGDRHLTEWPMPAEPLVLTKVLYD